MWKLCKILFNLVLKYWRRKRERKREGEKQRNREGRKERMRKHEE